MILPIRRETVVLVHPPEAVVDRLRAVTKQGRRDGLSTSQGLFMGKISDHAFDITRILDRPENFLPQINGTIEETSSGSILFLKYTLQFSSKMFVTFWSLTSAFFAIFLWFIQSNFWLGLGAVCALAVNLIVTHVNFQRQYLISRKLLHQLLDK